MAVEARTEQLSQMLQSNGAETQRRTDEARDILAAMESLEGSFGEAAARASRLVAQLEESLADVRRCDAEVQAAEGHAVTLQGSLAQLQMQRKAAKEDAERSIAEHDQLARRLARLQDDNPWLNDNQQ